VPAELEAVQPRLMHLTEDRGTARCTRVHGCTPTPAQSQGGAAWGYVSCRNALSESGSLVTPSMVKRGEDALNPFTMQ
jgi:hypothetical protein